MEVEPSLFVDYCDDYQSPSPSWQRVHLDPPANTEILDVGKMSNNLTCFPCEGLILQKRYCRALVFIGTSSGLIHLGGGDGGAQVNQGLERALREAVDMLSLVLERTSLCWLEVTVRISIYSLTVLANKHLQKYQTRSSALNRCKVAFGTSSLYSSPTEDATNLSPYRIAIHTSEFCDGLYFQVSMASNRIQLSHPILLCLLGSSHVYV